MAVNVSCSESPSKAPSRPPSRARRSQPSSRPLSTSAIRSLWSPACRCAREWENSVTAPKYPCEMAVDTASGPHYNTAAYLWYRLRMSRLTDQGLAYEQRAGLLIRTACRDDVPPSSHPFSGEATAPDPRLISSPGGGVSPQSIRCPCLERSDVLAKPTRDAIATAAHASVKGDAHAMCMASKLASR
jgi:hypothetical protein